MIYKAVINAFAEKIQRKWDMLYFAIDLHGTIIKKYTKDEIVPYPYALEALKELCNTPDITLILFTSTYPENLTSFYNWCKENGITFKYLNENKECPNSSTGDFSKKFYYNVLIDDRAGFDPEEWEDVLNAIRLMTKMHGCKMSDCSSSLQHICNTNVCFLCYDYEYYSPIKKN
jgi:hypothetical protein